MGKEKYIKKSEKGTVIGLISIVLYFDLFFILFVISFIPFRNDYKWNPTNNLDQIKALYIVDAKSELEYEIIKEISVEKKDELVNDLTKKLNFYKSSAISIRHTSGIGFLIVYNDDSYDLIPSKHQCNCVIIDGRIEQNKIYVLEVDNNNEFERLIVKYLVE